MGNITDALAHAFRDFVTPGVISSGKHEPTKTEIRAVGPLIEAAIAQAALGALVSVTKTTRALLNADLAHAADSVALVYADAADSNNDLYIKVGASGSGSWTLTTILHDVTASLVAAEITPAVELSQAWAEGTLPGGAGTKSAKEHAQDAAVAFASTGALVGAVVSPLEEHSRVWRFARHGSSSGLNFNANGDFTLTSGGSALWIIGVSLLGAVAGGPFEMRIRLVSGSFRTPVIQQFNGGTNLNANLSFTQEGDTLVARTDALNASCNTLRLSIGNSGAGAEAAVFNPPRYTVTATRRTSVPRGVPNTRQVGLVQDAAAKNAVNRFRDDWVASSFQGSGGNAPVRVGNQLVVESTRSGFATSTISGLDPALPIAAEFRSDTPLFDASIEFIFAGGSPANVIVPMGDFGNYWGAVIPANTLTATPISARFVCSNITDAPTAMHTPATARIDGFSLRNASRLTGDLIETWTERKIVNRISAMEAERNDRLRRNRRALTAARRAEALANPLHIAQANIAMMFAMQTATMWVDAINGNDANSGATRLLPKRTWAAALAATTNGQTIMLRNGEGQDYDTGPYVFGLDRTVIGWGDGTRRARIDIRQRLSGLTWTNISGNVWEAVVTHREALGTGRQISASFQSNFFNFWLWFPGDVSWTYLAGSDTIAARTAAVEALPGSGFVYKDGSTNPEPRFESGNDAATVFRYRIHMPDSSNPNGKDIRIADRGGVASWANGGRLQNLDFIGNARKDNMAFSLSSPSTEALRIVDNCRFLDCPEHSFIGLPLLRNYYYAKGRPAPGTTAGALGRSLGSCANFFTGSNESLTVDIDTGLMEVEGFGLGVFGHGGDPGGGVTGGFRSLRIPCLVMRNCGTVMEFSLIANSRPYIRQTPTIDHIDAENVGGNVSGTVNGGWIALESRNDNANQILVAGATPWQPATLRQVVFSFAQQNTALCWLGGNFIPTTTPGWAAPIITFDGCIDISPVNQKGHLLHFPVTPHTARVDVRVIGNSRLGALLSPSNDYLPDALTIEAGSEAGLFNEDRAGIIARMTAASKTVSIDAAARIVSHTGIVLSDLV